MLHRIIPNPTNRMIFIVIWIVVGIALATASQASHHQENQAEWIQRWARSSHHPPQR